MNTIKRKRGRPKTANPKTKGISIRLTEKELEYISLAATCQGMERAEWARKTILRGFNSDFDPGF